MTHEIGPKDALAAGMPSATYRVPQQYVDPEILEDFASMEEGEFRVKYFLSAAEYTALKADPTGLTTLVKFGSSVSREEVQPDLRITDSRPSFDATAMEGARRAEIAAHEAVVGGQRAAALRITAVPLGDKVLLWRIPMALSLISLSETSAEKPVRCLVIHGGTTSLTTGMEVLIRTFSGTEVEVGDCRLTVIHQDDILLRL